MRASVAAAFHAFNRRFEGEIAWMYPDIEGLITTGVGNLIDPIDQALGLPWQRIADGQPADRDAVAAEWRRMKADATLPQRGAPAARRIATLELSAAAIGELVERRLQADLAALRGQPDFAGFDGWPAPAQLALLSMAWAQGAGFQRWPRFRAACRAGDFDAAAAECRLDERGNPGLAPRNAANIALFHSAAQVVADGDDRDALSLPPT